MSDFLQQAILRWVTSKFCKSNGVFTTNNDHKWMSTRNKQRGSSYTSKHNFSMVNQIWYEVWRWGIKMRFHLIFCWRKATHKTIVCSKEILKQVLHRAIPRCFFECPVNYKKVTIMYYFQFTFERIIKGLFINNISIVQVPVHSGPSTDDPLSVCAL